MTERLGGLFGLLTSLGTWRRRAAAGGGAVALVLALLLILGGSPVGRSIGFGVGPLARFGIVTGAGASSHGVALRPSPSPSSAPRPAPASTSYPGGRGTPAPGASPQPSASVYWPWPDYIRGYTDWPNSTPGCAQNVVPPVDCATHYKGNLSFGHSQPGYIEIKVIMNGGQTLADDKLSPAPGGIYGFQDTLHYHIPQGAQTLTFQCWLYFGDGTLDKTGTLPMTQQIGVPGEPNP